MCVAHFLTSGLMPTVLLRVLLDDLKQFFIVYIVTDSRFSDSEAFEIELKVGPSGIFREWARELMRVDLVIVIFTLYRHYAYSSAEPSWKFDEKLVCR